LKKEAKPLFCRGAGSPVNAPGFGEYQGRWLSNQEIKVFASFSKKKRLACSTCRTASVPLSKDFTSPPLACGAHRRFTCQHLRAAWDLRPPLHWIDSDQLRAAP
jgi:hypothetical protein